MCTCGLTDLQWPPRAHVRYVHETVGCPIPHFSVQKGARERELVECLKWTIKIKCYLTNTFFYNHSNSMRIVKSKQEL